ncbi:MAG: DnaJ domain-containing protein [Nitrospiraceae bacterium]|nr:DnaJ domain-containing protein [Nitrospiraceae bacterium]
MEIPLTGSIKDVSLVKLLVFLNRNRKTGTLSLKTPVFTKKIYIHAGDAIFASSTYEDDRLGEMLLKADKITVEQYDRSVEVLKRSKKRQGAILVELGYLTPKDLFWGVKYQVKEIIHSMFLIEDAEYEFMEGKIPNQEVITLKMSMANLIYDGVKKIENWTRIRNEMPDTDSVFRLSRDPLSLFQGIELSSQDKKILSLIDGRRTIREVIENSWMGSFEALKILYVLWSIGIIEQATAIPEEAAVAKHAKEQQEEPVTLQDILSPLSEEEALVKRVDSIYPQLDSLSMYELLDAGPDGDAETIKRNYYRLAKEFHPDRYFAVTDESVKSKLTEIFDAITKAYNVLKDEKTREEYFRSLGTGKRKEAEPAEDVRAEDQFRRGVEEFKKGNFWGAVENFKWATKLMPRSAQYWSYLSLAFSRMPGRLKDAEEALLTAVKIEPFNPDHYANLGLVYMKAGIKKRACSNFEKALRIDPSNEKAKKGLEQTKE